MSAIAMPPDAAQLERLEAAFLRSPSSLWPPATGLTVEPPVQAMLDPDEADAWVSKYRTYTFCCKYG